MSKTAQLVESHREGAEVYHGHAMGKKKCVELMKEMNFPLGLLPLPDIEEVGHNRKTGFFWVKQKQSYTHTFRKIGRQVWYDTLTSSFIEDRRMKKVTGIKAKELLIWLSPCDVFMDKSSSSTLTFSTAAGLRRSFPASAFDLEEENAGATSKK